MRDAPERIWADRQRISKWVEGTWTDIEPGDPLYAEYLRVDSAAARVEALQAEVERLREEVEKAGREANIARYGEPDFAWSIHKAAMADLAAEAARLRADLAVAREALAFYSCKDGCNDCSENERDLIGCGWAARAALARITQEAPE